MANERIIRARAAALPPNQDGVSVAPFQFVLSGTESLFCYVTGAGTGIEIKVYARILKPDGTVSANTFRFVATSIHTLTPAFFPLGEGALLNVQIIAGTSTGLAPNWATCFVREGLAVGDGPAHQEIATLVQAYITSQFGAIWPGTPFRSTFEGPGRWSSRAFGNAAAGASLLIQGQTGEVFRLSTLTFRLTTSGTAGNRNVYVQLKSVADIVATCVCTQIQNPSQTIDYTAVCGGRDKTLIESNVQIELPPGYFLQGQDNIVVAATGLAADDQFTNSRVYGERWVDVS